MFLFLMKISGLQTDPRLWDTRLLETPSTPEVDIFLGQILPNLSLAVDPLALPSLRSLLLGSRFTASLSKICAISRCPLCTGFARQQRL
jgi:hypothetical protein